MYSYIKNGRIRKLWDPSDSVRSGGWGGGENMNYRGQDIQNMTYISVGGVGQLMS